MIAFVLKLRGELRRYYFSLTSRESRLEKVSYDRSRFEYDEILERDTNLIRVQNIENRFRISDKPIIFVSRRRHSLRRLFYYRVSARRYYFSELTYHFI